MRSSASCGPTCCRPIWRTFRICTCRSDWHGLPVVRAGSAPLPEYPMRLLFEGARSGTGEVSDWQQAAELAGRTRLILAGGLHAGNVAEAIRAVRPFGVDTSSGVESRPGVKCATKILRVCAAARAAFGEIDQ